MDKIKIKSFTDLITWKEAHKLVLMIYKITKTFPKDELFGLTDQIKRASVSIPSNIAEGASRNTTKEFVQFLYIALGSASELETQIIIAEKLGYLRSEETLYAEITVIRKMLNALITSLKKIVNGG